MRRRKDKLYKEYCDENKALENAISKLPEKGWATEAYVRYILAHERWLSSITNGKT